MVKKYSLRDNLLFYYKRLFEYSPLIVVKLGVYVGISVALPLFSIYLPKLMIDLVQRKVSASSLAAALGGFIAAAVVCSGIADWLSWGTYLERNFFRNYLLYFLFRKFLHTPYHYTEDAEFRKKYTAAVETNTGGDWSVSSRFFKAFPNTVIQLCCFLLYSAVIGRLHPAILLLLLLISGINYRMRERERRFRESMRDGQDDVSKKLRVAEYNSRCLEAAKDLRIFGLDRWLKALTEKLIELERACNRKLQNRALMRESMGHCLDMLRDLTGYGYLAFAAGTGQIGAGDFVLYFGAIQGFGDFLNRMIDSWQELLEASDRACRYREYYDLPDEEDQKGEAGTEEKREAKEKRTENAPGQPFSAPPSIDFEDVSFGYEEGKDMLSHFTLHIAAGEKLALVGENGAGKTTFVKLLAGFYEPREGCIKIGGRDAASLSAGERYCLFSAVFQENRCFPFTVLENLTLTPAEKADRERAREALERAGIWEDLQKNGISLDSYMTKYFLEDGVELSGGQMQRFMLARALYRDAPILVLDEPTAALDPKAESEIYEAYAEMTEGKTAIFISHRLASTRFSDRIVLISDGKIAECGTHEELMAAGKEYAKMFALQASYYQENEGNSSDLSELICNEKREVRGDGK